MAAQKARANCSILHCESVVKFSHPANHVSHNNHYNRKNAKDGASGPGFPLVGENYCHLV